MNKDEPLETRHPDATDIHVGARVRSLRRQQSLSQTDLAGELGLTFQQVQKYEKGTNRISSSKLYEIANRLGVPVGYFFEGLTGRGNVAAASRQAAVDDFLASQEGIELAKAFMRLRSGPIRREILKLVRALGEER